MKCLRSENAVEFVATVATIREEQGIRNERSVTFTPEQISSAERMIRTIAQAAHAMLFDKFLPKTLWAEIVHMHSAFVWRRSVLVAQKNAVGRFLSAKKTCGVLCD